MLDIKYLSIILIFLGSIAGFCLASLVSNKTFAVFFKVFAAGVILSLSVVHIIPDIILENPYEYPIGCVFVLLGIFSLSLFDSLSHTFNSSTNKTDLEKHLSSASSIDTISDSISVHIGDPNSHEHSCITNTEMKKRVNPYVFEIACIFHSILIGISLGTQDDENIKPLVITIVIHQFIEGTSLGWVVDIVGLFPKICLMIVYSVSTPIGILIGMKSYDNENIHWKVASTCLLGFSGGLLLYISLVQIFIEEISKQELHKKESIGKKLLMYTTFFLGLSVMSVMAIWI